MYHRVRRKMHWHYTLIAILIIHTTNTECKAIDSTEINYKTTDFDENLDNNIIDFDSAYNDKLNKMYNPTPWYENSKESHRYTVVNENNINVNKQRYREKLKVTTDKSKNVIRERTTTVTTESNFMPFELMSTTEDEETSELEVTIDPELTVIPLSTTVKTTTGIDITTITVPITTLNFDTSTNHSYDFETTENVSSSTIVENNTEPSTTTDTDINEFTTTVATTNEYETTNITTGYEFMNITSSESTHKIKNFTMTDIKHKTINGNINSNSMNTTNSLTVAENATKINDTISRVDDSGEIDVPIFTELDVEDAEVPEDYYDAKDVLPTKPPNVDALSLIFGLAGSVVESVAERVVPKGIFDLYKRMQKQNEALEAERLRSREENGGLGQFGRGILKTISSGLSAPFTQLMAGARDIGSLDSDRGFVNGLASGVTNVANSVVDAFKTRVQAIYPGTLWCGDGHSAQARSSDLGLFFFTDTCCRQHDACKLYIRAGETKYGLTNTGLFTRSHCSCDAKFRGCLQKTGSLVSGQIGLTYFNVLGPQCFRKAHPIVRCIRRTRITGQKCEEYELDYTKPKMWQWFDNETF